MTAADRRLRVASEFAARVKGDDRVREVWFADATEDAALTLIVTEPLSLEQELYFEGVLAAVGDLQPGPFGGFLRIHDADEDGLSTREGVQFLP